MKKQPKKPKKPRKDFPLYAHNRGYWAKKIKGKLYYFGKWDEPEAAMDEYKRVCDDLYAGRTPSPPSETNSLLYCCNLFIHSKTHLVDEGRIKPQALKEHKRTCEQIMKVLGKTKLVSQITALDMLSIEQALGRGVEPTTKKVRIGRARTLFNWLHRMDLVDSKLADKLETPSKSIIKKAKNKKPKNLFTPVEVKALIRDAKLHMKPCILLGINCGFGNRDVVELTWAMIGKDGWIDFPRGKTGIERRVKLWPETIKALIEWRKASPKCDYVVCDRFGKPVGANGENSPIANQFAKMFADSVELNGRAFYTLRHTFRTVADGCKDSNAARRCMGHSLRGIDGEYIEAIEDDRLEVVAETVHDWLFAKKRKAK